LLIFVSIKTFAQSPDIVYTKINTEILGQDAPAAQQLKNSYFMGSDLGYAVYEFSNILREGMNNKKEQQRIENARQQSIAKLGIIKGQYTSYPKFPDSITSGWHDIIATDNINFCKDAKVFVKNNRITKFVIDNYIPVNFISTGSIRNAKNIVTLKNFNGEQLNVLDVYFIYDIEEPKIVDAPIEPGYVCFWTDREAYEYVHLKFDGKLLEKFKNTFESRHKCFTNGQICRILKPGIYSFSWESKGAPHGEGSFEVKSGQCVQIRIGRGAYYSDSHGNQE